MVEDEEVPLAPAEADDADGTAGMRVRRCTTLSTASESEPEPESSNGSNLVGMESMRAGRVGMAPRALRTALPATLWLCDSEMRVRRVTGPGWPEFARKVLCTDGVYVSASGVSNALAASCLTARWRGAAQTLYEPW